MCARLRCFFYLLVFSLASLSAEEKTFFQLFYLGVQNTEIPRSTFLIAPGESNDFIAIDPCVSEGESLQKDWQQSVKAYLISHCHLHHLSALILHAPLEKSKNIYAMSTTIERIRDHLFNWEIWPNYADEGKWPHLNHFHYVRLKSEKKITIHPTRMSVEALQIEHPSGVPSTAFFIESDGQYLVYLGAGFTFKTERHLEALQTVLNKIAGLIRQKKCRAIIYSCGTFGFPVQLELLGAKSMYALLEELRYLAKHLEPGLLHGLKVIIPHAKNVMKDRLRGQMTLDEWVAHYRDLGIDWFFLQSDEKISL